MDQVANLLDRPRRYYNIDGMGEFVVGFMALAFALLMWLEAHASTGSVWNQPGAPAVYCAVLILILHYGSEAVKKRITYPRTGFVAYQKRYVVWLLSLILVLFGFLSQWWEARTPRGSVWGGALLGVVCVGLMILVVYYGRRVREKDTGHPRTGSRAYRAGVVMWRPSFWVIVLGSAVLVSTGVVLAARAHWDVTTPMSLVLGLFLASCYAYGIARGVPWKWIVVGAMVLGSLVIAFLPADMVGAVAGSLSASVLFSAKFLGAFLLCFLTYGALLLISGGISFWLYLRHTQAPAQESQ